MKQYVGLAALVFVGIAAWRIAGQLSADALGMAVGVLFGVMAGVPTALMVMASGRRRAVEEEETTSRRRQQQPQHAMQQMPHNMPHGMQHGMHPQHPAYFQGYGPGGYPPQPPVIVLAGPGMGQPGYPQQGGYPQGYGDPYGQRRALPAPEAVDVRQFKVVGEKEEWVDEW